MTVQYVEHEFTPRERERMRKRERERERVVVVVVVFGTVDVRGSKSNRKKSFS